MTDRVDDEMDDSGDTTDGSISRRGYATLVGTTLVTGGLAGCTSGSDGGGGDETTTASTSSETTASGGGDSEELPEGVSEEEFTKGPVPEAYRAAVSLGGEERTGGDLVTKEAAQFGEYDEVTENAAHQPGQSCGNCSEFIPDKNGDGFGACAKVEGYIGSADWCTLYEALPEPDVPSGMTEDELATAQVPSAYRTAASQGGETRKPEDLVAQESANLTESIEAIAEGPASPGQACGNCAEFIPDQNGDGWGACAKVDGYIAAGDWCTLYEHVTKALEE